MTQYLAPPQRSGKAGCIASIVAAIAVIAIIWMFTACNTSSRYRVPDDVRHTVPAGFTISSAEADAFVSSWNRLITSIDTDQIVLTASTDGGTKLSFQEMAMIESKIMEVLEAHPDLERRLDYRLARIEPGKGRAESFRLLLRFLLDVTSE